ncbi:MAG: hypothetical protein R3F11_12810 [Verrucomicrobiales bacterium]
MPSANTGISAAPPRSSVRPIAPTSRAFSAARVYGGTARRYPGVVSRIKVSIGSSGKSAARDRLVFEVDVAGVKDLAARRSAIKRPPAPRM